eukprot:TRINITY_DN3530_c0_g1_i1.p1 TRINITY_DN3530_c0_g1~~TRINITY_DN3530_c0_g1_i1.p1  ORF type:complete len:453 (+),score=74.54 TRINITY_DN3530_c0_g1_i1:50-1408(+)
MENLTSIKSISDVFTTVPSVLPSLPSLPKDSIIQCQKCGHLKQGTTGMMGLAKSYLSQKCSVCQKDNTYEGVPAAGEKKCWEWGKLNTTTTCCDKEVTEEDLQNCRNCGDVICKQCTVKAEGVPGYTSPGFTVPVCKACYGILDARLIVSLLVTAVSQELGERVVNIIDCLRDNHPKLEAMRLTSKVASGNLPTTCKILLLEEQGGAQLTRIESTSDDFPDKWKDFWTRYSDAAPTPSLDDQCTVCDASPTDCRCRRYFSSEGEVPKNVKVHLQSGAMDRDTVNILNVVTSTLVKSVLKGIPVEVIPQERWKWVCPNCQCESSGKNWHARCEVCLTKSLKVCNPPEYKPAFDALSRVAPWLFPDKSSVTDKVNPKAWNLINNGSFSVCIADQLPLVQNLGTAEDVRELGSALKEFSEAWHLRQHLSKTGHVPYCKKPFACSGLCAMQYLVAV